MEIKHIMNPVFQSCFANDSLKKLSLMLAQSDSGSVIVVNGDSVPIGVITQDDIDKLFLDDNYMDLELVASDIIKNKDSFVCWEDDYVEIGLSIINDRKLSIIPVVNNEFYLVGILQESDALCSTNNIIPFQACS